MNEHKPAFLFHQKYFALRAIIILAFAIVQIFVLIPMAQRKFEAWKKLNQAQMTTSIAHSK